MTIIDLADRPEAIPSLATWFRREWEEYFRGRAQEEVEGTFVARMHRDTLPIALLAVEGNNVIGTVSLVEVSIASHVHLGPWIGGLYVVPDRRGRGVATALVRSASERARNIGFERLYIAVAGGLETYRSLGWRQIDAVEEDGETYYVLVIDLVEPKGSVAEPAAAGGVSGSSGA